MIRMPGALALNASSRRGFTLTEVVLSAAILSVVFLGGMAFYTASIRFFRAMQTSTNQNYSTVALEDIFKKVNMANNVTVSDVVGGTAKQLKIRWDYGYNAGTGLFTANNPPTSSIFDDSWVKYRFIADPIDNTIGRLYWRVDQNTPGNDLSAPNVANTDPELVPGLLVRMADSSFTMVNPTGGGNANVVEMVLATRVSTQATNVLTRTIRAKAGQMTK